ncbi:MAG: SH3 domain-containing protein [Chloroflexota bacterium]
MPAAVQPLPNDFWQVVPPAGATPPDRTPGWRITGTEGSGARLRDGPSIRAGTITTLPEGALVDPVGGPLVNDGLTWTQVRPQSGGLGWVADQFLQPPVGIPGPAPAASARPPAVQSSISTGTVYVIGETDGTGANLRERATTQALVVALLPEGTVVEPLDEPVTADGRAWRKVRANGREGWIVAVVVRSRP